MTMTAAAQFGVTLPTDRILLRGHAGPVIERLRQAGVAGVPPQYDVTLAAAAGDGSGARQRAQDVVISPAQRLAGLGEQRGDVDPSEPWTGTQDLDVALLADLPRTVLRGSFDLATELVQPLPSLLDLLINQPHPGGDDADVGGRSLDAAWPDRKRRLPKDAQHGCRIQAPDAVAVEDTRDGFLAYLRGLLRGRDLLPQLEEPIGRHVIGELTGLRVISPQLTAQPVGEASAFLHEFIMHARPFAQLDHQRVVDRQAAKGVRVGAQGATQHIGVAAVVLGAHDREPVTKAVELLRIDGKDLEAMFQQRLDHRSARRFDRHADLSRRGSALVKQPGAQLRQCGSFVLHITLSNAFAIRVKQANAMLLACPIKPNKPTNLIVHRLPPVCCGHTATLIDPCTGARGATSYRTSVAASLPGHRSRVGAHGTGGMGWLPADRPVPPVCNPDWLPNRPMVQGGMRWTRQRLSARCDGRAG